MIEQEFINNTWENQYKTTYDYNAQGKITNETEYIWDVNNWNPDQKTSASYNQQSLVDTIFHFEYSGSWIPTYRNVIQYDSFNNIHKYWYEMYDSGQWEVEARETFVYDNSLSYNDLMVPLLIYDDFYITNQEFFNHKLDTLYFEDYFGSYWSQFFIAYFYYSDSQINIEQSPVNKGYIYPNPFSKRFYVSLQPGLILYETELYDFHGKKIRSWKGKRSQYEVPELQKGVYFVKFRTNRGTWIKKIIVNRK